jgi:hypothetical protein
MESGESNIEANKAKVQKQANITKKDEKVNPACRSCFHRIEKQCLLSGFDCNIERQFPTRCGVNFDGWTEIPIPKRRGLKRLFLDLWYGEE